MSLMMDVSISTILEYLRRIGKVKKLQKWFQHELSESKKKSLTFWRDRFCICGIWLICFESNLMRNGSLIHDEGPKLFPKPKFHQQMIMLSVLWSTISVMHYCLQNRMKYAHLVNQIIRTVLVNRRSFSLLHGNAQSHTAWMTLHNLTKLEYESLIHPPYTSGLSPIEYPFFKCPEKIFKPKHIPWQRRCRNCIQSFFVVANL